MSFWDKFKSDESHQGFEYEIQNETVIENVKKAGYEVKIANDYQLFLDLDTEETYHFFLDRWKLFVMFMGERQVSYTERFSIGGPPGRHVIVEMKLPMEAVERIAWQASMGSDQKKEFNNMLGVHFNIPHYICLFNKKEGRRFPR